MTLVAMRRNAVCS